MPAHSQETRSHVVPGIVATEQNGKLCRYSVHSEVHCYTHMHS